MTWLRQTVSFSELVLFLIFLGSAGWLLWWQNYRFEADAVATLVGALFGAAVLLLGNWINRQNEIVRGRKASEGKRRALNGMITPELVNTAAGMLQTAILIKAAATQVKATRGSVSGATFAENGPREMLSTMSLGAELLYLAEPALDALVTLQANLATMQRELREVAVGNIGLLRLARLAQVHSHNMEILAECFERIAPTRRFVMDDDTGPELVSTILRARATAMVAAAAF